MTFAESELERHRELTRGRRASWEAVYRGLAFEQLLSPPPLTWTPALLARCEELYRRHVAPSDGRTLGPEQLEEVPAWVFLEFLTKKKALLVHGSTRPDIELFEPRTAGDTYAGGEIPKVYAASGALAAFFYAILDRKRLWELPCLPAMDALYVLRTEGERREEGYWFTTDYRALSYAPWRSGTIYVLPREPFTHECHEMQWYSKTAVRPLVRLSVTSEQFPLLEEVRGIDWFEHARRDLKGFPFRDDLRLYPPAPGSGAA